MTLSRLEPGDVVLCRARGFEFPATFEGTADWIDGSRIARVTPHGKNINHFHVPAADVMRRIRRGGVSASQFRG